MEQESALQFGEERVPVRRVGFGTMAASGSYGPVDEEGARAAIRAALEAGPCLIDTADVYGSGSSETEIGRLVAAADTAIIATKVGLRRNPTGRFGVDIDGSPEYLREAVGASRVRLGVDVIDLVYLHRVDDRVPVEDSLGALGELVTEGVLRGVGISEASAESVERAHKTFPLTAVQSEFSLWSRDVEDGGVIGLCADLGIRFVASSPLGKGFLTGALEWPPPPDQKDSRTKLPRFSADAFAHNATLLDLLADVATEHRCTMAQAAIAWVLAWVPGVIAIPSTRSADRVRENLASSGVVLSDAAVEALSSGFASVRVEGDRYADMGFVNR
jgi:aryl-alcohol dehydrogenase-like predicted oxidoreductase